MLEKTVNDLRMKLVDLETRTFKGDRLEGNFLARRIQDVHPPLSRRNFPDNSWRKNYKIVNKNSPKRDNRIVILSGRLNLSSTKLFKRKKREHAWNRIYSGVMRRMQNWSRWLMRWWMRILHPQSWRGLLRRGVGGEEGQLFCCFADTPVVLIL